MNLPALTFDALFWVASFCALALIVYAATSGFTIDTNVLGKITLPDLKTWQSRVAIVATALVCAWIARFGYVQADWNRFVERVNVADPGNLAPAAHLRAYDTLFALAGTNGRKQCYLVSRLQDNGPAADSFPRAVIDLAHDALTAGDSKSCMNSVRDTLVSLQMRSESQRWGNAQGPSMKLLQREVAAEDLLYGCLVRLTLNGTKGTIYLGELAADGVHLTVSNIDRETVPKPGDEVYVVKPLNVDTDALPWDRTAAPLVGVIAQNSRVNVLEKPTTVGTFAWAKVRLEDQAMAMSAVSLVTH